MTQIFDARHKPIHLPDTPTISRTDADLIFRADVTMAAWMATTDTERADLRWRIGA